MSKSRRALQAIVGALSEQLARGWASLEAARRIDSACPVQAQDCARTLASTVYEACVESAILALARLVVTHKDSVNVTYLLNCVQQSPSAFPIPERDGMARTVERHRLLLDEMQPLVDQVKDYRDRTIAHLDKRVVNHWYAVHAHPPIELDQVERAFARIGALLNVYRAALDLPALERGRLQEGGDPSLARVLQEEV